MKAKSENPKKIVLQCGRCWMIAVVVYASTFSGTVPCAMADEPLQDLGLQELRQNALADSSEAMFALGRRYYHGKGGADKNLHEAFRWFEAAAARDHIEATQMLQICYFEGKGVTKNVEKSGQLAGTIDRLQKLDKERKIRSYIRSFGNPISEKELRSIDCWEQLDTAINFAGLPSVTNEAVEQRAQQRLVETKEKLRKKTEEIEEMDREAELRAIYGGRMSQYEIDKMVGLKREASSIQSLLLKQLERVKDAEFLTDFANRNKMIPGDHASLSAASWYGTYSRPHIAAILRQVRSASLLGVEMNFIRTLERIRSGIESNNYFKTSGENRKGIRSTRESEQLLHAALILLESERSIDKYVRGGHRVQASDLSRMDTHLKHCETPILLDLQKMEAEKQEGKLQTDATRTAFGNALRIALSLKSFVK